MSEVNKIAERESTGFGRRHYRPVYVMHKWWARRLGSIFRTIVLYSLLSSNASEIWNKYGEDIDLSDKVILDPMMGGGTTIVESLRFSCNVIGVDLNPVAWFVVKKQIEDIDPLRVMELLKKMDKALGDKLRRYYYTTCPYCEEPSTGIYYFHVKEIECKRCKENVPLMRNYILAKSRSKNCTFVVCPGCYEVFEVDNVDQVLNCPRCNSGFNPKRSGNIRGRSYVCPNCGIREGIVEAIRERGKPKEKMYAIEYYCSKCDASKNDDLANGRGYKASTHEDLELQLRADEEYQKVRGDLPIPAIEIPKGVETKRALNHGYRRFSDMFSSRQLLTLGKILKWIIEIEEGNVKEFFLLAFSNCLKYNNTFCKYNATQGFITDIFRTHSFSPSMAPVEGNVYDIPKGRGAFTAFVKLIIEGKEYCRAPFERIFEEGKMHKRKLATSIDAELVQDPTQLIGGKKAILRCGSSHTLDIPSKSVDAVITDPPYADNVMYSELSNFFYVWLKPVLSEKYECFRTELVPWEEEIIENETQGKGAEEFLESLITVFSESKRVLKENGILVFTFHHKKIEAWKSILRAILQAGFTISATHPVRSEMKASTHLYKVNNITIDMIIVCRKRTEERKMESIDKLRKSISKESRKLLAKLKASGKKIEEPDIRALVLGKCMEVYSRYYSEDNQCISKIQEVLSLSEDITKRLSK
ncbi:MAG: DUF1156 domain-containing protein [Candidatus Lokiarchaeota archaeon]|nr:DUF1156 domain-containing protein [Candidatus Lokiarchaeota archaeon]